MRYSSQLLETSDLNRIFVKPATMAGFAFEIVV